MGLAARRDPGENDTFAKTRPLVLSRHTKAMERLAE
jgi:hypothetical protein